MQAAEANKGGDAPRRNDGKEYEIFVEKVMCALFKAQQYLGIQNAVVKRDITLKGISGSPRQFDVYWEYEMGGKKVRAAIECKDYNTSVSVEKIDALMGRMKDFPDMELLIASRKGFQKGAKTVADAHNVRILIIRDEDMDKDWRDEEGNPLIKRIIGNIHCMVPWSLIEFHPVVDLDWARDNGIEIVSYNAPVSEVYVLEGLETPPITLESIINAEDERCKSDKAIKEFRRNYDNTDAYLEANGKRIKIKGFIGRFRPSYTLVDRLEINPEVIGVIEYILQKQKTMVMRQDGHVMVKTLPIK